MLLNELDLCGTDSCGFFSLLFKKTNSYFTPKLEAIYLILIRRWSFPVCLRTTNATSISKGTSVLSDQYRSISITPILSGL